MKKLRYDYRVLGFIFFVWALLNFLDGVNALPQPGSSYNVAILNIFKGMVGFVLAGYLYFSGNDVDVHYKNNGDVL